MANESQQLDQISRAVFALLLVEPFHVHIVAGMPREASYSGKTTGTGLINRKMAPQAASNTLEVRSANL